jgi:hypothetical protein
MRQSPGRQKKDRSSSILTKLDFKDWQTKKLRFQGGQKDLESNRNVTDFYNLPGSKALKNKIAMNGAVGGNA